MGEWTRTGGRDATTGVIPGRVALSVGCPGGDTPNGFKWTLLTDIAQLESGHTPSRKRSDYWDGDIPWIGIREATSNHGKVINDTEQHVTQTGLDNSSARLLPAGTVCLSRTASVGFVVGMGRPMATSQDFVNWICGPELNNNYLRYLLMLEQDSVRRFAYGTTHQTMYYPEAKALHILIPDKRAQDAIAEVLGALDDKIAANEKLQASIDELVSTLYARCIADVGTTSLSSIADVNVRNVKPHQDRSLRYLDIASVGQGGYDFPARMSWSDAPSRARRGVERGDTVWSTVRPNRRSHALILDNDPELVASTGLAVLHPHDGRSAGLFEATRLPEFESYLLSVAHGSAYPAVNARLFKNAPIPNLSGENWDAFEAIAWPLRERAHGAQVETRTLARTRDELLPLLMSGKIRVRDAEKTVEEVI